MQEMLAALPLHVVRERKSWIDVMESALQDDPHHLAYSFVRSDNLGTEYLRYDEVLTRAKAMAASLQASGCRGQRALLLFHPGTTYITALLACFYAGVVAVPVYAPRANASMERIDSIQRNAQVHCVLSTQEIHDAYRAQHTCDSPLDALHWRYVHELAQGDATQWRHPDVSGNSLALLQFTSGSTAQPKGVMVSHGNLLANSQIIQQAMQCTPETVGVVWLPPYHDMGLVGGLLQPLYARFTMHLFSPAAFLQRPMQWLKMMSSLRATLTVAPNFAYELCVKRAKPDQLAALDLSAWRVAGNGAEPIRSDVLARFAQTFAPCGFDARAFYPCYGLAESTLFVSGPRVGAGATTIHVVREALMAHQVRVCAEDCTVDTSTLVSCGQVPPALQLAIVSPESGRPCEPLTVGEIWVRGDSVAAGYWQRPEETAATFHCTLSTPQGTTTQWLRTGDLGVMLDGELYVTGRIKDLIIIGGQNHYPQDLEATVMRVADAVMPMHAAALSDTDAHGERLVLVVELRQTQRDASTDALARRLREAISLSHQLHVDEVVFMARGSIRRTSSGKTQRRLTRLLWQRGEISELPRATPTEPTANTATP